MDSHTSASCEDCGATHEQSAGWSKPSGTAGHVTQFSQPVQRADWLLGHRGYLCTHHWWERIAARQRQARVDAKREEIEESVARRIEARRAA